MRSAIISALAVAVLVHSDMTPLTVSGTVRVARSSQVVSGVSVELLDPSGRSVARTVSDSTGRYSMSLAADATQLRATRVGYRPVNFAISRTSADSILDLAMDPAPEPLDTVKTERATHQYMTPRMRDFEARRLSGLGGNFISEQQLRDAENMTFPSVIRTFIPGARVETSGGQAFLRSRSTGNLGDPKVCYSSIFLDGSVFYEGAPSGFRDDPPDLSNIFTSNLSGVEYYRGGASLPVQFRSRRNECGTLILWSRAR